METVSLGKTKVTKLVMDGFKSFGKYTELLFGDEFNVILGPNGSGKSNVLDALCFVLGKSSSKQLRAEKSANLIYNGGKTKQPAKKAEVSIVFDNKDNAFPVDDQEVKVSRIVRSDGASKYKINGQTRTRTEVVELLNNARINPDGYNIILQGDIIRLVEMSTNERRQIIEEIAGIGVYEEKKQQALKELTKVEDKLNEAEIVLKERQSYLKDLKKDRDQALKYKELSDKIKTNKATHLKRQKDKKEEQLGRITSQKEKHIEKLEKWRSEVTKGRNEINELKKKIKEISEEIEKKGETELIDLQKQVETIRIDLATHKTKIGTNKTDLNKIEQRKQHLDKSEEDLTERIDDLKEEKNKLEERLSRTNETINDLDSKIEEFRKKHNLEKETDIDEKIEKNDKESEKTQQEINELREKQQQIVREKDKIEFQLSAMDEKIQRMKQLEKEHEQEIKVLKQKKEEFKKTTLELNDILNKDSAAARELVQSRNIMQEEDEHLHKLELKQNSIKENVGASIAVKKILENRKEFGNVYGTIGELGTTSSKYATALEVAAANKMNSIITDDDRTAAKCIQYLKGEKFGIATFLPLNKIKPANKDIKEIKQPGVHGLALDLIEYDPKFKNAFSHVFGSTIVVENINAARKIGVGKCRMVTLDGDLTEHSGAMIGGHRHKKTGMFREKELTEKIEKTKERLAKLQNKVSELEHERKKNDDKIVRLRELKANLEGEIIKQEKSLHIDTSDLEATEKYKEELQEQIKKYDKQKGETDRTISEKIQTLTKLKMDKQELRRTLGELRNPRVLAELNAFEEKRKSLDQERIRFEEQNKNLNLQIKEFEGKDKQNTKKLLKELEEEKKGIEKEIEESMSVIEKLEKDLKIKETEQQKFSNKFKELFENRNKHSDEITKIETEVLSVEEKSRKEELSINTSSIQEAQYKAELAGINAEYTKYEGVKIDEKKSDEDLKREIQQFERMMNNIGNVNMRALEIYETAEKEYNMLTDKKKKLLSEKEDVIGLMDTIEERKTTLFTEALKVVNDNFQNIFGQLTTKGKAHLELENTEKVFEGGLRIKVKLTGNKFMDIRSLSGGEKTLTALAFLFAIQEHQPATFYVMDEVDAALDKSNSEKLAKLIRSYCGKAQYIVISHNDAVIGEGDTLYGVSMKQDSGLSKVVGLKV